MVKNQLNEGMALLHEIKIHRCKSAQFDEKKLAVQLIKVLIKKAESSIYPFILQRLKGFVGGVIRKIDAP